MATVRQTTRGESSYPEHLAERLGDDAPSAIHILGDVEMPSRVDLALVCSVSCPGSVIIKMYDAIRSLREAGVIIAGGFHSPMERECLDFLLRGEQAVVFSPAFGIDWLKLGDAEQQAVEEHRLVVASILGPEATKATRESALVRNAFVAALADEVFVPHAVPEGQAELTARQAIARGQVVLTLDDPENARLLDLGARPLVKAEVVAIAARGRRESQ